MWSTRPAWVAYADGSDEATRVRGHIEGEDARYTPAIVVAELADRSTRPNRRAAWSEALVPFIRRQTAIVPLDTELADRAGQVMWEIRESSPQAGLADAVVLATARQIEARVLTGDPDFLVPALVDEVIDVTGD